MSYFRFLVPCCDSCEIVILILQSWPGTVNRQLTSLSALSRNMHQLPKTAFFCLIPISIVTNTEYEHPFMGKRMNAVVVSEVEEEEEGAFSSFSSGELKLETGPD